MKNGKTESGFEYEINENITKDHITLKYLVKMTNDPTAVFSLIDRMVELGLDESALYKHCETDGIVPIDKVTKEVTEIIQSVSKNS